MLSHRYKKWRIESGVKQGIKMIKKSYLFLDTITNKIDIKGRVSIPADYRLIFEEKQTELILYRSFKYPCIEGCTSDLLENLANKIDAVFDDFSLEQDNLTSLIYADSKIFVPDSTGRISLTPKLITHAQLSDVAAFVGKGKTFQIWQPTLLEQHLEGVRKKAFQNPPTLSKKGEENL